jgi:hypothetical protein
VCSKPPTDPVAASRINFWRFLNHSRAGLGIHERKPQILRQNRDSLCRSVDWRDQRTAALPPVLCCKGSPNVRDWTGHSWRLVASGNHQFNAPRDRGPNTIILSHIASQKMTIIEKRPHREWPPEDRALQKGKPEHERSSHRLHPSRSESPPLASRVEEMAVKSNLNTAVTEGRRGVNSQWSCSALSHKISSQLLRVDHSERIQNI